MLIAEITLIKVENVLKERISEIHLNHNWTLIILIVGKLLKEPR